MDRQHVTSVDGAHGAGGVRGGGGLHLHPLPSGTRSWTVHFGLWASGGAPGGAPAHPTARKYSALCEGVPL